MSTCEGGILIDLAGLKGITVDPAARTARAGGGVLWGEFDAATQAHGLHTPGGRVTTTGVGGFTTGGGYGWTSSKYGLTCDNLLSAQVVLADGRIITASERDEPDLFWGIRGGGGNFGIVTEFEYRLHPLGPLVLAGSALWPIERASEVMRAWRDYVGAGAGRTLDSMRDLTAPPEHFVPDSLKARRSSASWGCTSAIPDDGAQRHAPDQELGPVVDLIQPMPYTVFQSMIDAAAPKGLRNYWRGEYLAPSPTAPLTRSSSTGPRLPPRPRRSARWSSSASARASRRWGRSATAFSHREARILVPPDRGMAAPENDERLIAASRAFCDAMRPFATGGAYLNFTPEDRVREAYGAAKYERLVAVKDRYDPDNLFRLNQNIRPSRLTASA